MFVLEYNIKTKGFRSLNFDFYSFIPCENQLAKTNSLSHLALAFYLFYNTE